MFSFSQLTKTGFGTMPTWFATWFPLWNRNSAGIPLTPSFAAFIESVSVLTFATVTGVSSAICSNMGVSALQGPHQGAQKSTRTHSSELIAASNVASSTVFTTPILSLSCRRVGPPMRLCLYPKPHERLLTGNNREAIA